jgi:group I intron endonuclease
MFYIYKLTCLENGKGYVGVTNKPSGRMARHRYEARHGSILPLYCAMRKHGIENFEMIILQKTPDRNQAYNVLEPQLIKEHNTNIGLGYNLGPGGEGYHLRGRHHSEETKEKMRQAQQGRPKSEEHKQHLKDAKSTPEAKEHMRVLMTGNQRSVGYHHSDAAKKAIRQSRIGKHPTDETRMKMSIAAKKRCGVI